MAPWTAELQYGQNPTLEFRRCLHLIVQPSWHGFQAPTCIVTCSGRERAVSSPSLFSPCVSSTHGVYSVTIVVPVFVVGVLAQQAWNKVECSQPLPYPRRLLVMPTHSRYPSLCSGRVEVRVAAPARSDCNWTECKHPLVSVRGGKGARGDLRRRVVGESEERRKRERALAVPF